MSWLILLVLFVGLLAICNQLEDIKNILKYGSDEPKTIAYKKRFVR